MMVQGVAETRVSETPQSVRRLTIADLPQLATCKQLAEVTGCSVRHIAHMCERGELKAVKLGKLWRINRDAAAERLGL